MDNPKKIPENYHPKQPIVLDLAGAAKAQSRVLSVKRVGFISSTDDDRSPESFPLPACMASVMETLGEDYGEITIYAHNRSYTKRLANHAFLGASGMAFGLLWSNKHDFTSLDLTLISPLSEVVRRICAFAGYTYELFSSGTYDKNTVYRKIIQSIDNGMPVITFGLFGHTECALIAGYENLGQHLVGWSHFQSEKNVETADNGMFRISDWDEEWTSIVILHDKVGRSLSYSDALAHGLTIMQKTEASGYLAGYAAFDHWISAVSAEHVDPSLFSYHDAVLFNYAELRAWGSDFLRDAGASKAADLFMQIHDLCWKANAITPNAETFAIYENRCRTADILKEMVHLDHMAEEEIKCYLGKQN
ncbi:MAG: hypothetical protein J6I50_01840 [Clostridia bacterium]|nr:hypothetical protein [Clostridia bacterium]